MNDSMTYQSVDVSPARETTRIMEEGEDSVANTSPCRRTGRLWMATILCMTLVGVMLRKMICTQSTSTFADSMPMMGKSLRRNKQPLAPFSKKKLLEDCIHFDVKGVTCHDAWPFFSDYIAFQHAIGTEIISEVGENTFELEFAGSNVTLYVSHTNETDKDGNFLLSEDVQLVGGFDFFETYHENFSFLDLPMKANKELYTCRSVKGDKRGDLDDGGTGCRVFHSFLAVFGGDPPVTLKEWNEAADEEAMHIRKILETSF